MTKFLSFACISFFLGACSSSSSVTCQQAVDAMNQCESDMGLAASGATCDGTEDPSDMECLYNAATAGNCTAEGAANFVAAICQCMPSTSGCSADTSRYGDTGAR